MRRLLRALCKEPPLDRTDRRCRWIGRGALSAAIAATLVIGASHASKAAGSGAEPVTLAWRDSAGKVSGATVDKDKLTQFMKQQTNAIAAKREDARITCARNMADASAEIFAKVNKRIPKYADWYFQYSTKYVLMSRALRAALVHMTRDLRSTSHEADVIHAIETSLSEYLRWKFVRIVLEPSRTPAAIEAAYARTKAAMHEQWDSFLADQDRQLVDFIRREGTPLDPSAALGLGRADRPPVPSLLVVTHHEDVQDAYSFRRGLLNITVDRPRMAAPPTAAAAQDQAAEDAEAEDQVTGVIVNLFTAIVDPVASRVGDLVISIAAGGVAGAMAGGSGVAVAGMGGVVSGAAAVAPIAAVLGGVVSISTDFAASRFEESLTRPSFEKDVGDIVETTRAAVNKTLTSLLYEHIDAMNADMAADMAIRRLVVSPAP
jgi:hypothetical protein